MGADPGATWDQHLIRIICGSATFGLLSKTSIAVERAYVQHRFSSENHTFCWSKCDSGDVYVRKCACFLRRGCDFLRTGATFGRRSASKIADSSQFFFTRGGVGGCGGGCLRFQIFGKYWQTGILTRFWLPEGPADLRATAAAADLTVTGAAAHGLAALQR